MVNTIADGRRRADLDGWLGLLLFPCQIFFTVAIIGKASALVAHMETFVKPDVVLGFSQITVMLLASFLELVVILLLASTKLGDQIKFAALLLLSSGFVTYHLLAIIHGTPGCPCFGNFIAKESAAKISFASAILLFIASVTALLRQHFGPANLSDSETGRAEAADTAG
jgi:hypothetical protein